MRSMTRSFAIASSLIALTFVATPAFAICKYGTPHCINPHPGPSIPKVNTNHLPDQPPGNEDCMYYGNCDDGSPEGTGPDGGQNGGLGDGGTHNGGGNGGSPALGGAHVAQFHVAAGLLRSN
jgi:hypothetical protein